MFLSISFFASVTLIQKFHLISFVIFIVFFFSQRNEENHNPNQIYIPSLISITNLTRKSFHRYQLMFFLSETQSQEIGKTIMRKQSSDCNVSSGPYRTLSSVYLKPSRSKAHGKIVVAIYFLNY